MIHRQGRHHISQPKNLLLVFLVLLLLSIVLAAMVYAFVARNRDQAEMSANKTSQNNDKLNKNGNEEPMLSPLPNVQSELDAWLAENPGEYSVVVTDLATKTELASHAPDEPYFGASLYKLYVAYLGYIDVQEGLHELDEPFLGDWTRGECLDKMLGESHSPCAEKMWAEQGKEASTVRLKALGLKDTSMTNLTTTAHDVNAILERLDAHRELSKEHTQRFLSSLKKNIYRDVLPKALPDLTVYDKVGFEGYVEYHDVGIVELENGRRVAITMLTRNAGTRRLVDLSKTLLLPMVAAVE